ncbi:hypothetical protein IEQ34_001993 [Dendrobium chrysotoxum]|uniref:Uncharacterized protein n=1 Tax=Dendrobium chrysotoxum TaxID=161865 RepID=A0AAV7HIK9_DENCH|nr:hypothetical protein IEQ34_001993 [Dendrobium chrysotoxum]
MEKKGKRIRRYNKRYELAVTRKARRDIFFYLLIANCLRHCSNSLVFNQAWHTQDLLLLILLGPQTLALNSKKTAAFSAKVAPFPQSTASPRNSSSKSASALPPSPRDFSEHKENESDFNGSKPARTRSPAEKPYKGIKSFMAPTISASSKIAAASPRKKILSEKNDVLQDSVKSPSVLVEGVKVEEILPKSEMDFESEDISDRNRSRMMDFSGSRGHYQSTGSRHPSCCHSDADPSLPPYDPMTNYLSPRPQFLHYKPKPMIEQNHGFTEDLFYVGDGRRLEDSFSDTEGSDVCSEYTEETKASPVNKGQEDEYVSTKLNTQEALVPDETYVSEPKTRAETYKPRIYNRSFRKSKIIPFLLFSTIVFSCLPLADLPIFSPVMKYESFVGPHTQAFGVVEDVHPKYYLAFVSRNIQGLVSMLRQWLLDSIIVLSSSGYTSRDESDMMLFFNMTISPSIIQNVDLDFGYSSELETVRKKETVEGRNDPVNTMESEFELDKMVRNALVRNDIDNGEKLHFKLSDVNRDGARDKMVQEQEDYKYAKYEDLNSLTDPVFEFVTTNKKYQTKMIDVAISDEVDGKGYPAGFEIVQVLEEQILVDLKQENSHSSIDEKIKVGLPELNGAGAGDEMVQKGEEDYHPKYEEGLSSFMVQPKKIDIAISEEVHGDGYLMQFVVAQKLEEQVLMGLRQENIHLISKDHVDSSTELVVASQMKNQKDDAGVVNFLSEVQPSVFANTNLILPVLGVLAAVVLAISLVFLLMKQKHIHATSDKKHLNKKNRSVSGGNVRCTDFNNESPYHNLKGLAEVVGDSGPTEMSSSLNNSFSVRHQRKKIASHEVTPNYETLQRRESGVSSSISYGSFTALEKTSARKGEKDDEVMAPVRRSSRIRNQAMSG